MLHLIRAIEEDVDLCIFSMYEDFSPEDLGSILAATVKTHGVGSVIANLESRNRTTIIGDMLVMLKCLEITTSKSKKSMGKLTL